MDNKLAEDGPTEEIRNLVPEFSVRIIQGIGLGGMFFFITTIIGGQPDAETLFRQGMGLAILAVVVYFVAKISRQEGLFSGNLVGFSLDTGLMWFACTRNWLVVFHPLFGLLMWLGFSYLASIISNVIKRWESQHS